MKGISGSIYDTNWKEPVASNHLDGSTFPLIACSLISNSFPAIAVFVYTSIYAFRNVVVFQ